MRGSDRGHWRVVWTLCAAVLAVAPGCKKSSKAPIANSAKPQYETAPPPGYGSAAEQRAEALKKLEAERLKAAGSEGVPWGKQVKTTVQALVDTTESCEKQWLRKLDPAQLVLGRPAIPVEGGDATAMNRACRGTMVNLERSILLLDGTDPKADELLRHWTLFADLYSRASRIAINVGAKQKRRKLNAKELEDIKPELLDKVVPALLAAGRAVLAWPEDRTPTPPDMPGKMTPSEAAAYWTRRLSDTYAGARELEQTWLEKGYKLKMAELYSRFRHLQWLGEHWRRRVKRDLAALEVTKTDDAAFDAKLKAAARLFYEPLQTHVHDTWHTAMSAFKSRSTVDENALKAGKEALAKSWKAVEKGYRAGRIPSP